MKCINKKNVAMLFILFVIFSFTGCGAQKAYSTEYEKLNYNQSLDKYNGFARNLCVTNTNVNMDGYTTDDSLHAAGLFDVSGAQVLYSDKVFDQIYPASTTKIMTAYVVLKHANLDEMVTVSDNAVNLDADAQVCGLQAGDQLTLGALLNGLLLYSGNDNAIAIAEYMAGSVSSFADMMNQAAIELGATHSHFLNPHGLHEEGHYTTAYDLYLIFNACIQDQRFVDIIAQSSYNATITNASGEMRSAVWEPTNYYSLGNVAMPDGVRVLGGKTGTTDEAGSCVILYNLSMANSPYISVIMGADNKDTLYSDMTALLSTGINR